MKTSVAASIFRAIEAIRGENVVEYLAELEATQFQPAQEILRLQRLKVELLLDSARRSSAFYRDRLPDRWESVPLLLKEELRDRARDIVAVGHPGRVQLCKTSGSTGVPLKFYRDSTVFGYTLAALYRGHRWHGLEIGAKEAMLWGIPSEPIARTKMHLRDLVLNRFREREYDLSPEVLQSFYDDCRRKRPAYVFGYTSMVYEFALFLQDRQIDGRALKLHAAICTAESIPDNQRAVIEEQLGCRVVSEYGSAETGIISYQCAAGSHHVSDDTVLLELLDDAGRPVADGEIGRVVITVLHSQCAPIIRYALGDLAIRKAGTCSCGVNLSMLDQIVGRSSGIIVTPSGRCFHSIALYYIMKDFAGKFGNVRQFKAIQTHPDHIELHLVLDASSTVESESYLMQLVKKKFGNDMRVTFIKADMIPRNASGKMSDFESRVDAVPRLLESFRAHI